MKPGEYAVLVFVLLMLSVFFGVYIWFQIKRIKRNKVHRKKTKDKG